MPPLDAMTVKFIRIPKPASHMPGRSRFRITTARMKRYESNTRPMPQVDDQVRSVGSQLLMAWSKKPATSSHHIRSSISARFVNRPPRRIAIKIATKRTTPNQTMPGQTVTGLRCYPFLSDRFGGTLLDFLLILQADANFMNRRVSALRELGT